jgi:serine/threonine-protein kinase
MVESTKALLAALHPLLDRALDLAPAERAAWLARLGEEHAALVPELEALLAAEGELDASRFLESDELLPFRAVTPLAGRRIGAYTLERPLGQGGMGTVWLARRSDGRYEGLAAVKLLNLALLDPVGSERFRREGAALARLTHPNIARLIDAGVTDDGQPFLVLEYVEGRRIDVHCDERHLDPRHRLGLFLQVLSAVGHAHANLIVHRDLKPSNILVTTDGTVKLLDFGIAKLLEAESGAADRSALTDLGGLALTPEYAAPEQVLGRSVTTATDVYALGVLLYLLLVGRHPTGAGCRSVAEHLRAITDTAPERPSAAISAGGPSDPLVAGAAAARTSTPDRLRRFYQGDLDTIVAKALKKDPAERYATVAALADDIQRLLRHEPISARRDSVRYRLGKLIRRHRAAAAAATVTLAALVGATVFSIGQMREARRQRDSAVLESKRQQAMADVQSILAGDSRGTNGHVLSPLERIELADQVLGRKYRGEPWLVAEVMADLSTRLYETGDRRPQRDILARARSLAVEGNLPVQLALADCLRAYSLAYDDQVDSARADLAEARAALGRAADRDSHVQAVCRDAEGQVLVAAGSTDSGTALLASAAALTADGRDQSLHLQALNDLAGALRAAGRPRDASRYQRQILAELESTGYGDTEVFPNVAAFLSATLWELGELAVADSTLHRFVQAQELIHGPGHAATTLTFLYGVGKLRLGDLDSAEVWIDRALQDTAQSAASQLSIWRPAVVTQLRLEQGRLPEARAAAAGLPAGTHVRQVTAGLLHARLRRAAGDVRGAAAALEDTLRKLSGDGARPPADMALAFVTAAEWRLAAGDARGADSLARIGRLAGAVDSLATLRSGYVGRADLVWARALRAQGDLDGARRAAEGAVVALAAGYGASSPRADEARVFRDSL